MRKLSSWSIPRRVVRGGLILCCAGMLCLLSGCVVALLAPLAYGVTKVTQGSIKSTVKVKFEAPLVEEREALAGITSLAIWPQDGALGAGLGQQDPAIDTTALTETLSQSEAIAVVTPLTVARIMQSNAIPGAVQSMTKTEKLAAFQQVVEAAGLEGVLYVQSGNTKLDASVFKLGRNTVARAATLFIYSRAKRDVVWQETVTVSVAVSTKSLSESEIQAVVAPQVSEKILVALDKKQESKSESVDEKK